MMFPDCMGTKPLMARKRVVLPAPLGPRTATFSPRSTERDTPRKTGGALLERTTTRSLMLSTGNVHYTCTAGIAFALSKHFQFVRDLSHSAIPIILVADK